MKSILSLAAFLMTILLSPYVWASAFTITQTQYEISGQLVGYGGPLDILQQYAITSSSPLAYEIHDTTVYSDSNYPYSFAKSIADESYVYVSIAQPGMRPFAHADAISKIFFAPNVDGYVDGIFFSGQRPFEEGFPYPGASWSIKDLTSNTLIVDSAFSYKTAVLGPTTDPITYISGTDYYWNSSHNYELTLSVDVSSNHHTDQAWISTNMFVVVPDPSSILLLSSGLAGLLGFRKRMAN